MWILLAACAAYYVAGTVAMFALARRIRRPVRELPPITILKPLCGVDDDLEANLDALGSLDAPGCQVVFGAADPCDAGLALARRVAARHPRLDASFVVSGPPRCSNPKVANLIAMTRAARHPWLYVSDSNVRLRPGDLRRIAAEFEDDRVGIVTNVFVGTGGARLENLHLATFQHRAVAATSLLLGLTPVLGKSMLLSRETLERIGGWEAMGEHLAEDFVCGRWIQALGMKVALSSVLVRSIHRTGGVRRFALHQLRWAVLRRRHGGPAFLLEFLFNPALVAAVSVAFAPAFWPAAVGLLVLQALCDLAVLGHLRRGEIPAWQVLLTPLKDLLAAGVGVAALLTSTVVWRGKRFRVSPEGLLAPAGSTRNAPSRAMVPDGVTLRVHPR